MVAVVGACRKLHEWKERWMIDFCEQILCQVKEEEATGGNWV